MAKVSKSGEEHNTRPALSPQARENQLISAAINLAEKQLLEGTASSQVITHYLRLGTMKEQREREKLEEEIKLLKAKTDALESAKKSEELFTEAMRAFKRYQGNINE